MPTRPAYPAAFREQLIALVQAGRSPEDLAKEFEPTAQTIRNWVVQSARDRGIRTDGPTSAELAELRQLRRENKQLKIEREILSKAAAWFARETGTIPKPASEDSRSRRITRPAFLSRRSVVSSVSPRVGAMRG